MFKMEKGPKVALPVEQAAEVAAAPSIEDLAAMENPTEEDFRLAAEKIVERMIEEDLAVRMILEAKIKGPIVDRKTALIESAVKTLKTRVEGIKKGWADPKEVDAATRGVLSRQVSKYGGMKEAA